MLPHRGKLKGHVTGYIAPPPPPPCSSPAKFTTLINALVGNLEGVPFKPQLLDWEDRDGVLTVVRNRSATFAGTPAAFFRPEPACGTHPLVHCSAGNSGEAILRLRDGTLLVALYGIAEDGGNCTSQEEQWEVCYSIVVFKSTDDGSHWNYASRINNVAPMPTTVEGPSEPAFTQLSNGNAMIVFREQGVSPRPLCHHHDVNTACSFAFLLQV